MSRSGSKKRIKVLPLRKEFILEQKIAETIEKFPKLFDYYLHKGWHKLVANSSNQFISSRCCSHLKHILLVQFFLQKRIEKALEEQPEGRFLFLKLFPETSNRLCTALTLSLSHDRENLGFQQILKAFQTFLPGIGIIKHSFFSWKHPELPYLFYYLEVQKLRGRDLSTREIRKIEKALKEQIIHCIIPLTPAVFYPYNEEESYRQLLLLEKEVNHPQDLPIVSIYFQEQSPSSLEFLIHLVRVESSEPIDSVVHHLPASVYFFRHHYCKLSYELPLELWVFSLKVPSHYFFENDAINLLYARRHIAKYIEQLVGPFRDFNGGLYEKQQEHIESLKTYLAPKIPYFSLFGEKLLYALQPIEAKLSLSLKEAERLLMTFSKIIKEKNSLKVLRHPEGVLVVKTAHFHLLHPLLQQTKKWEDHQTYAQLTLSGFHYLCILDKDNTRLIQLERLLNTTHLPATHRTFRLSFEEGEPPSLNPHHVFGDIRCRALSKLLFEGLVRLDEQGKPQLAAAQKVIRSQDGLSYTFQIRPHCWSNGERVTSFHYLESYRTLLRHNAHYTPSLFIIKNAQKITEKKCPLEELGVSAPHSDTLIMHLEWPDPAFLYKLAHPFFFPMIGTAQEPNWFNGPYLIQKRESHGMFLEANPYYWDHSNIFFQMIQVCWGLDINQCYDHFLEGKIDWIGDPLNRLTTDMVVKSKKKIQQKQVDRALWLYLNTNHNPLSSRNIRRALSLSINRSYISKHIFTGSIPLYHPLPLSLSLGTNFFADNDILHSRQLFERGLKEIGVTKEQFPQLILSYPNNPTRKPLAEYLKIVWEKVFGIKIQLKGAAWNDVRSSLEEGNFHIAMSGVSALYPDPSDLLDQFDSQETSLSRWEHPLYRKKLALAREALRLEERKKQLSEAESILMEHTPIIPVCNFKYLYIHHPKLKGYTFDCAGCVDFKSAYLEE